MISSPAVGLERDWDPWKRPISGEGIVFAARSVDITEDLAPRPKWDVSLVDVLLHTCTGNLWTV